LQRVFTGNDSNTMSTRNGDGVIRVVVAAISAVRRGGLEAIVRNNPSFKLAGSLPGIVGFGARIQELQPHVMVVDLAQADTQLFQAANDLERAGIATVALIDEPSVGWTARALRAGVRAILPRESSENEIASAVVAADRGLILLDPEVTKELASQTRTVISASENAADRLEELTAREVEVLRLMAEGFGNKQIAARLGISDHTVKFHISSILAKLSVSSRTEAVTQGIRMGLIVV
jgi:two-component system, NarL family, response regulator YdfI